MYLAPNSSRYSTTRYLAVPQLFKTVDSTQLLSLGTQESIDFCQKWICAIHGLHIKDLEVYRTPDRSNFEIGPWIFGPWGCSRRVGAREHNTASATIK